MPTMAARNKRVFSTVELLETVLFELDMRTLLLSQRVNRTWKSTIEGSPALQQMLFFKAPLIVHHEEFGDRDIIFNPLLTDSAITVSNCGFRFDAKQWKKNDDGDYAVVTYYFQVVGPKILPPESASWRKMYFANVHFISVFGQPAMNISYWKTQREPFPYAENRDSSMEFVCKVLAKEGAIYEAEELDDGSWLTSDPRAWLRGVYQTAAREVAWMETSPDEYYDATIQQIEIINKLKGNREDRYGGLRPDLIMSPPELGRVGRVAEFASI